MLRRVRRSGCLVERVSQRRRKDRARRADARRRRRRIGSRPGRFSSNRRDLSAREPTRVDELERTESQRQAAAVPVPATTVSYAPEVDITEVQVDELEVYLLARLVAQRSVGQAGRGRPKVRASATTASATPKASEPTIATLSAPSNGCRWLA